MRERFGNRNMAWNKGENEIKVGKECRNGRKRVWEMF
jgi:hypothetical protein